jgi:single-strand DNA-binding protein
MNFNKVILGGNLTRDPETRAAGSSTVCNFGLAINRKYKDKEETTFVDCEAWGATGENIARYCTKGRPLLVEGELALDQWTDKDGNKRSKLKVRVYGFQFVGGKPEARGLETVGTAPAASEAMDQDDIPF